MPRHAGLLVFVVALAVRLAYLALVADDPAMLRTGDTPAYERAAAALAATGRESVRGADGRERLFVERPPGYVGWLAGFRAALAPSRSTRCSHRPRSMPSPASWSPRSRRSRTRALHCSPASSPRPT